MIPNAQRMFNFDLGETADAIRETVRDFSTHEIAPRADEIDKSNQFPRDLWPKLGALGLHGITVEEEYGAPASATSSIASPWKKSRGRRPRSAELWRAFQFVRQRLRRGGGDAQKAEISAKTDFGRACRCAGDVGARAAPTWCHDDAGRQEGRPLCHQRQQDVDHQWADRGNASVYAKTDPAAGPRGIRLSYRERHEGFSTAQSSTSSACAVPTRRTGVCRLQCRRGRAR